MINKLIISLTIAMLLSLFQTVNAQQPKIRLGHGQEDTWIWYPGDYEIWLSNQMQNRRTDRGTFFPVFWKIDSHYP